MVKSRPRTERFDFKHSVNVRHSHMALLRYQARRNSTTLGAVIRGAIVKAITDDPDFDMEEFLSYCEFYGKTEIGDPEDYKEFLAEAGEIKAQGDMGSGPYFPGFGPKNLINVKLSFSDGSAFNR